jgi:phosphoenolpyruvate carboxykinase (GTP)
MLIPPASYQGWKVWTVGDDIAWLHPGKDGRLYAINPESGYFGVVPGTNPKTNRNAYETIRKDTIFTNVGVTADNQPWWEGLSRGTPVTDWQGRPYDPANGPAAQPNSRFTVAAKLNPAYSKMADAPGGVPISAIVFGGRRRTLAPLVFQARNWLHGVLLGAGVASETTAAITGKVGVLRRDPMAPGALEELLAVDPGLWRTEFKGIADYFGEFGTRIPRSLATELNDSLTRVTAAASE